MQRIIIEIWEYDRKFNIVIKYERLEQDLVRTIQYLKQRYLLTNNKVCLKQHNSIMILNYKVNVEGLKLPDPAA